MSFFSDTEESIVNDHGLWAEKYRPSTIENYMCDEQLREIVTDFIKRKDIPHLLFHGTAGTGKTTLAKIITKNIPCDVMYVNASDNTGVDFVRDKIKPFASTMGFNDLKIVILDEADYMSANSQASLRNLMETYSKSTRFILTCNYIDKIISPLISRTQVFQLEPPSKKDVAVWLTHLLKDENVKYDLTDIKKIVDDFYPDVRKVVNYSQQVSASGEIKHVKNQGAGFEIKNRLIELLRNSKGNKKVFNEIRQLVNDAGTKHFDDLYSTLYNKSSEYDNGNSVAVIVEISESLYQNALVVDKEITFMACIAKLIKIVSK